MSGAASEKVISGGSVVQLRNRNREATIPEDVADGLGVSAGSKLYWRFEVGGRIYDGQTSVWERKNGSCITSVPKRLAVAMGIGRQTELHWQYHRDEPSRVYAEDSDAPAEVLVV